MTALVNLVGLLYGGAELLVDREVYVWIGLAAAGYDACYKGCAPRLWLELRALTSGVRSSKAVTKKLDSSNAGKVAAGHERRAAGIARPIHAPAQYMAHYNSPLYRSVCYDSEDGTAPGVLPQSPSALHSLQLPLNRVSQLALFYESANKVGKEAQLPRRGVVRSHSAPHSRSASRMRYAGTGPQLLAQEAPGTPRRPAACPARASSSVVPLQRSPLSSPASFNSLTTAAFGLDCCNSLVEECEWYSDVSSEDEHLTHLLPLPAAWADGMERKENAGVQACTVTAGNEATTEELESCTVLHAGDAEGALWQCRRVPLNVLLLDSSARRRGTTMGNQSLLTCPSNGNDSMGSAASTSSGDGSPMLCESPSSPASCDSLIIDEGCTTAAMAKKSRADEAEALQPHSLSSYKGSVRRT